jgi:hypothetical protein
MREWEDMLAKSLSKKIIEALRELSFTRLCWLVENYRCTVVPFLRGDFDRLLREVIPSMPLRQINAEDWLRERDLFKPHGSP